MRGNQDSFEQSEDKRFDFRQPINRLFQITGIFLTQEECHNVYKGLVRRANYQIILLLFDHVLYITFGYNCVNVVLVDVVSWYILCA